MPEYKIIDEENNKYKLKTNEDSLKGRSENGWRPGWEYTYKFFERKSK